MLLVDDSTEDNFIHTRQLKRAFPACEVQVVLNGQKALDLLHKQHEEGLPAFDIIFLDVNMPVMDAWGFLDQYKNLPITLHASFLGLMIITALPSTAKQIAEQSDFVNFYITKPFDVNQIAEQLKRDIGSKPLNNL